QAVELIVIKLGGDVDQSKGVEDLDPPQLTARDAAFVGDSTDDPTGANSVFEPDLDPVAGVSAFRSGGARPALAVPGTAGIAGRPAFLRAGLWAVGAYSRAARRPAGLQRLEFRGLRERGKLVEIYL